MYPSPPICISIRITIFPKSVKSTAVSFTIKPVTQKADVEVNSASMELIPFEEMGKDKRIIPSTIIVR